MDVRVEKLLSDIETMLRYAGHLTDNGIKVLLEKAMFDFEQQGEGDEA